MCAVQMLVMARAKSLSLSVSRVDPLNNFQPQVLLRADQGRVRFNDVDDLSADLNEHSQRPKYRDDDRTNSGRNGCTPDD